MEQKSKTYGKWSLDQERHFCVENMFSGNAYSLFKVKSGLMIDVNNGKYLKAHKPKDRVKLAQGHNTHMKVIVQKNLTITCRK